MDIALKYLAIFATMLAYDFVWAKYTVATAQQKAVLASTWAAAMPFFIAFFSRAYVEDWKSAIPAAAGAFLGTYLSLRRGLHG